MAIGTITGLYGTALAALGAWAATRMASDVADTPEERREQITVGGVKYQIRASYTGFDRAQDSNTGYHTWAVEIVVAHKLASAANERAWTEGATGMPLFQSTLAGPAFWKVAGVFGDPTGIEFTDPPKRDGNVVSFAISAFIRTTSL